MASPNLTEIVTTTLRNRSKELADNVTNHNALLAYLSKKGNVRTADGGRTIVEELEYAENSTFMYYSGYEALNIAPSDVFSAAEYNWKQASLVVSASGLEIDIQNAGKERVIPLLEKRIKNAMKTMANNVSVGIYSDGTGTSGKQITGLQALVADDPSTGTVGGINRANFSFWKNYTSGDITLNSAATVRAAMQAAWLELTRGTDKPDLIVSSNELFSYFWDSLTDIQRVTSSETAVAGFAALKFVTADVIHDGGSGIADNHMYLLNTDYLYWRPHKNRNMVPLDKRDSINQDAMVIPVVFAGNLTMSNASLQGVIYT